MEFFSETVSTVSTIYIKKNQIFNVDDYAEIKNETLIIIRN
jgi:hypothetical protein